MHNVCTLYEQPATSQLVATWLTLASCASRIPIVMENHSRGQPRKGVLWPAVVIACTAAGSIDTDPFYTDN